MSQLSTPKLIAAALKLDLGWLWKTVGRSSLNIPMKGELWMVYSIIRFVWEDKWPKVKIYMNCYRLNVPHPLQILCWGPNPQGHGSWRWAFDRDPEVNLAIVVKPWCFLFYVMQVPDRQYHKQGFVEYLFHITSHQDEWFPLRKRRCGIEHMTSGSTGAIPHHASQMLLVWYCNERPLEGTAEVSAQRRQTGRMRPTQGFSAHSKSVTTLWCCVLNMWICGSGNQWVGAGRVLFIIISSDPLWNISLPITLSSLGPMCWGILVLKKKNISTWG